MRICVQVGTPPPPPHTHTHTHTLIYTRNWPSDGFGPFFMECLGISLNISYCQMGLHGLGHKLHNITTLPLHYEHTE